MIRKNSHGPDGLRGNAFTGWCAAGTRMEIRSRSLGPLFSDPGPTTSTRSSLPIHDDPRSMSSFTLMYLVARTDDPIGTPFAVASKRRPGSNVAQVRLDS